MVPLNAPELRALLAAAAFQSSISHPLPLHKKDHTSSALVCALQFADRRMLFSFFFFPRQTEAKFYSLQFTCLQPILVVTCGRWLSTR